MAVQPIPAGYHTVTPYLVVPGVANVLAFLEKAFDAKVTERMEAPPGTVRHAEVRIGTSMVMLGEHQGPKPPMPAMLYVYVPDTDATFRRALAAGATSLMEPANQFYGDRNAGVADSGGNQWWIATHVEDVPPDELARRAEAHAKSQQK